MLKNAYLDAKIGFDTEENEQSEICGIGSWYMYLRKCLQSFRKMVVFHRPDALTAFLSQPALRASDRSVLTMTFASTFSPNGTFDNASASLTGKAYAKQI